MNSMLSSILDGGPVLVAIVFMFIIWSKEKKSKTKFEELSAKIDDLHEWHDHDDPMQPGIKIWWIQPGIEKALGDLAQSITKQTEAMNAMMNEIKDLRRDMGN